MYDMISQAWHVLLCILLMGSQSVFERLSLKTLNIETFVSVRFLLATIVASLLYVFTAKSAMSMSEIMGALKSCWLWIAVLCVVLGSMLYYRIMMTKGVTYVIMTWPAMMALSIILAFVCFREEISHRRWLGIVLALSGTALALWD